VLLATAAPGVALYRNAVGIWTTGPVTLNGIAANSFEGVAATRPKG
jgi:hypothetical protein